MESLFGQITIESLCLGCEFVCACTGLCNAQRGIDVMDGLVCCSTGAISQLESREGHLGVMHHAGG